MVAEIMKKTSSIMYPSLADSVKCQLSWFLLSSVHLLLKVVEVLDSLYFVIILLSVTKTLLRNPGLIKSI